MWKISADDIRNFPIPLPPPDIQQRIVRQVDLKRAQIARERDEARLLAADAGREVEEMILGTRPVPESNGRLKVSA
jgi:hypothetical protein